MFRRFELENPFKLFVDVWLVPIGCDAINRHPQNIDLKLIKTDDGWLKLDSVCELELKCPMANGQ